MEALLADEDHQTARSQMLEEGLSEGAVRDLEWEMVNGRPDTDTSDREPEIRDLLRRRAIRQRATAASDTLRRVAVGLPLSRAEVERRRRNRELKQARAVGYESATTTDGEGTLQRARSFLADLIGVDEAFIGGEVARNYLAAEDRLFRSLTVNSYDAALQDVVTGKAEAVPDKDLTPAERRTAVLALASRAGVAGLRRLGLTAEQASLVMTELRSSTATTRAVTSASTDRPDSLSDLSDMLESDERAEDRRQGVLGRTAGGGTLRADEQGRPVFSEPAGTELLIGTHEVDMDSLGLPDRQVQDDQQRRRKLEAALVKLERLTSGLSEAASRDQGLPITGGGGTPAEHAAMRVLDGVLRGDRDERFAQIADAHDQLPHDLLGSVSTETTSLHVSATDSRETAVGAASRPADAQRIDADATLALRELAAQEIVPGAEDAELLRRMQGAAQAILLQEGVSWTPAVRSTKEQRDESAPGAGGPEQVGGRRKRTGRVGDRRPPASQDRKARLDALQQRLGMDPRNPLPPGTISKIAAFTRAVSAELETMQEDIDSDDVLDIVRIGNRSLRDFILKPDARLAIPFDPTKPNDSDDSDKQVERAEIASIMRADAAILATMPHPSELGRGGSTQLFGAPTQSGAGDAAAYEDPFLSESIVLGSGEDTVSELENAVDAQDLMQAERKLRRQARRAAKKGEPPTQESVDLAAERERLLEEASMRQEVQKLRRSLLPPAPRLDEPDTSPHNQRAMQGLVEMGVMAGMDMTIAAATRGQQGAILGSDPGDPWFKPRIPESVAEAARAKREVATPRVTMDSPLSDFLRLSQNATAEERADAERELQAALQEEIVEAVHDVPEAAAQFDAFLPEGFDALPTRAAAGANRIPAPPVGTPDAMREAPSAEAAWIQSDDAATLKSASEPSESAADLPAAGAPPQPPSFAGSQLYPGYDVLQVIDQRGAIWEPVAARDVATPPGFVRRRRSGVLPSGSTHVPRPAALHRLLGHKVMDIAILPPAVAQRTNQVLPSDRSQYREFLMRLRMTAAQTSSSTSGVVSGIESDNSEWSRAASLLGVSALESASTVDADEVDRQVTRRSQLPTTTAPSIVATAVTLAAPDSAPVSATAPAGVLSNFTPDARSALIAALPIPGGAPPSDARPRLSLARAFGSPQPDDSKPRPADWQSLTPRERLAVLGRDDLTSRSTDSSRVEQLQREAGSLLEAERDGRMNLSDGQREVLHALIDAERDRDAEAQEAVEREQLERHTQRLEKLADRVSAKEQELLRAESLGPVERALVVATESLEKRRKRRLEGREPMLLDALLAVRSLERGGLDVSHLYRDGASGEWLRETLDATTEAAQQDPESHSGQTEAEVRLAARERLAQYAVTGEIASTTVAAAPTRGRSRQQRAQSGPSLSTSLPVASGDELESDASAMTDADASLERVERLLEAVGGDVERHSLPSGVRAATSADASELLQAGAQASLLSQHGERVLRAREALGRMIAPGRPGELRIQALRRLSQRILGGAEWLPRTLSEDPMEKRLQLVEEAERVYRSVTSSAAGQPQPAPSTVTLNSMVQVYANAGLGHLAYRFLESEFPRWQRVPDERTLRPLLDMHSRQRRMDLAEEVFSVMREQGIQPAAESWGIMVHGYARLYRLGDAVETIKAMQAQGLTCPERWAQLVRVRLRDAGVRHPAVPAHPVAWQFSPKVLQKRFDTSKRTRREKQMARIMTGVGRQRAQM